MLIYVLIRSFEPHEYLTANTAEVLARREGHALFYLCSGRSFKSANDFTYDLHHLDPHTKMKKKKKHKKCRNTMTTQWGNSAEKIFISGQLFLFTDI